MAVFRIEKTRDGKPPSTEHETISQSKGASLPHALPPGGLGLYHQRACKDM